MQANFHLKLQLLSQVRMAQTQTSLAQSPCFTLFSEVRPSPDWVTPSLPPNKSYFSIHELILLMLGQCTNPGHSFPCLICHRPYIKTHNSYKYSSSTSWVHQKCPGLANASFHHNLRLCSKCQIPPLSPSKKTFSGHFFPRPTLIHPLMSKHFSLLDLLP